MLPISGDGGLAEMMVGLREADFARYSVVMMIALATRAVATTLDDGLERVRGLQAEAAARGAAVVCFPEAYLPGLRGQDFEVLPRTRSISPA